MLKMNEIKIKNWIILTLTCLLSLTGISEASPINDEFNKCQISNNFDTNTEFIINDIQNYGGEAIPVDCTITVKGDGIELEITFHDISWLRCAAIKVGKWLNDVF